MISAFFDDPSSLTTVLFGVALIAIALASALHALLNKKDSVSALGWVTFCLVLPLIGPVFYLVFGINRIMAAAKDSYHPALVTDSDKQFIDPAQTDFRAYAAVGQMVTASGLHSCDDLQVLENGECSFPAMLADIASAKKKIYLTTYIFQNDEIGQNFYESLCAAQARGVDVRLLLDGLGGIAYPPTLWRKLRRSELNMRYFNPITLLPPSLHINLRNHRKILVVDGKIAYTGGQNITDRHNINKPNNPKCARDLHFRLTGKIVDDLERAFLRDWYHRVDDLHEAEFSPSNESRSESAIWTRLILDGPNEHLDKLNEVLLGVFSAAQKQIWIMTPYFLPGPVLIGALQAASLRGVDVRIFLPERTNIHLAHYAAQHTLPHLLDKDLTIYLQPPPFIHTKAILVDDCYSLIGSANLDPRSLRLNFELGVEVFSHEFASRIADYFDVCQKSARRITSENSVTLSLPIRIRNAVAWLFSPYL